MLLSPDRISRAHCRASRDDSPPAIVRDNQHEAWPDLPPSLLTGCKSVQHNAASDGSLFDHLGSNTHSNIRYSSARLFALVGPGDRIVARQRAGRESSTCCGEPSDPLATGSPPLLRPANASA